MILKINLISCIAIVIFLNNCSSIRDSAGVTRKSIDEFQVVENPPLVIPPDFNLLPPDQLKEKNILNTEKNLAKEILFGLDFEEIENNKESSTVNEILKKTNAFEVPNTIRDELDLETVGEINIENFLEENWEGEIDVLNAIEESERIRNNKFENKPISEGETPIIKESITNKKKKRFIFF